MKQSSLVGPGHQVEHSPSYLCTHRGAAHDDRHWYEGLEHTQQALPCSPLALLWLLPRRGRYRLLDHAEVRGPRLCVCVRVCVCGETGRYM